MTITDASFAGSSTRTSQKPKQKLPEFAFIGRSNVGKSSLINMLTGRRKLAVTSSTPGKTKLVNHFLINGSWYLVDLPGYGYAKLPQKAREELKAVIRDYIHNSEELMMLFVLVDSRHDIGPLRRAPGTRSCCCRTGRSSLRHSGVHPPPAWAGKRYWVT